MRDLLMFAVMLALIPMALRSAFVAFLLWVYTSVLSPHLYLYGFMQGFRYTFVFAGITLMLLWVRRLDDRGRFHFDGTLVLMILFIFHSILSALFSMQPNPLVWFRLEFFLKGMVLALVVPLFLTSRWRIHLMLIVLVVGLGFHAMVDGLKMISSAGAHNIYGIPRSTLSDNNLYALGMVMLLPIFLYFSKYSAHYLAKSVSLVGFALCVMTVLGSNSRGGFLALAILGIWYWITSSRKFVSSIFVLVVALGVVQFAPERWFDRIETIKTAGEDGSFLGRVAAWKVSLNIANGNPIFGAGFHAVENQWIWDSYKDASNFITIDIPEMGAKAAHSNYFQVLGDLGYVGFFIFIGLLSSAFVTRWRIRKLASGSNGEYAWAADLATSINLSLVAFMAGGAGVSLAYYELVYLLIMTQYAIYRLLLSSENKKTDSKFAYLKVSSYA